MRGLPSPLFEAHFSSKDPVKLPHLPEVFLDQQAHSDHSFPITWGTVHSTCIVLGFLPSVKMDRTRAQVYLCVFIYFDI